MSKWATIAATAVLLGACSQTVKKEAVGDIKSTRSTIAEMQAQWKAEQANKHQSLSSVSTNDGIYLGAKIASFDNGDAIPAAWRTGSRALAFPTTVSIQQVAAALTAELGVPVQIYDQLPVDILMSQRSRNSNRGREDADGELMETALGDPTTPGATAEEPNSLLRELVDARHNVSMTGTWKQVLDQVAALYRVKWVYERGALALKFFETKTFEVNSSGQTRSSLAAVKGQAGGEQLSAGGTQSTDAQAAIDIWSEAVDGLKAIVPAFSAVAPTPSLGTVTVTAPVSVMPAVEEYFADLDDRLGRQIAFTLDIYSLTVSNSDNINVGIDLAFSDLEQKYGFNFRGIVPGAEGVTGSTVLSGAVLTPPPGSPLARFAGSQIVAEALKKVGNVSTVYSDSKTVRNYIPTAFQVMGERAYIARRTAVAGGVGTAPVTGIETDISRNGFSVLLHANIQRDLNVNVGIHVSLSELQGIDVFGEGENLIQLPRRTASDLMNEVYVQSGEMIVLSGYEQRASRNDKNQGGGGLCFLMCASDSSNQEIRKLFIVIRPIVLDRPDRQMADRGF